MSAPINKSGRRCLLTSLAGVFFLSLGVFASSFLFQEWYDREGFEIAAMSFEPSQASSEKFHLLRDAAVTPVFAVRDYAATVCLACLVAILWIRWRANWVAMANSSIGLVALPILSSFLLVVGAIAELGIGAERHEFPWWADTLAIPAMGFVALGMLLCAFLVVHWIALRLTARRIGRTLSWWVSRWLAAVCGLSGLLGVASVMTASWASIPSAALAMAFFVAVAERRSRVGS